MKILGLDIGTNSIGWSFIENDIQNHTGTILGIGSRIIPMEGREKDFEAGTSSSKAAERRRTRGARRLLQRYKIRRTRLIKVLKSLNWFPENFPTDFKELENFNINELVPFNDKTIEEAKKVIGVINKRGEETLLTDWIVYYLRTKGLTQKISLQELARVIYHFNQRRGFKSSRKDNKDIGDSEEVKFPIREKNVEILKINSIIESTEKSRYGKIYVLNTTSSNGNSIEGTTIRRNKPDWLNKEIELEITKIISKSGDIRIELRLPDRTDWEKMKIALEKDIFESGLHPGEYHLSHLINDRNYRIKERIIDRSFYKNEFEAIWNEQMKHHPELSDKSKLQSVIDELYIHNEPKRKELLNKSLFKIINDDIIYYQRDLKSQKHLVSDCRYERKSYTGKSGKQQAFKVVSKSHPVFQEFRIWQDIHNLRIIRLEQKLPNGKTIFDIDETEIYLNFEAKAKLFKLFDSKSTVSISAILKELSSKEITLSEKTHRLNYPEDKEFKGNETKAVFRKVFKRHSYIEEGEALMNDKVRFELLWHIIYSLNDEKQIYSALTKKKNKKNIENKFQFDAELAKHIAKIPEFPSQYASYSYKAINKLLPLMRCGSSFWNEGNINLETQSRIEKIINGEFDENINVKTRDEIAKRNFKYIEDFQGLTTFLSCYLVYGRHSEKENENKYEAPSEIKTIEQGELRNPIVEQITNETLQVVRDIWNQYGRPDEIHIELARDLKKNKKERQEITSQNLKNEADRKRIIAILKKLDNTNPDSINDMERLRLWEETSNWDARNSFPKFSKEPTSSEIEKYKLWGEQNHISPYTGKVIPLSKLFSNDYQIEHIIPRARLFDDSFGNKTICEAWVNSFKDKSTAMEIINEYGGRELEHHGKKFKLLAPDEFIQHIKQHFKGKKKWHFLSESIPEGFIERQLNDTRYIGKKLSELLYPVAKESIIFTSGNITSDLKEKWGLHRVWKEILRPRFERLEEITGEQLIDFDKEHNNIHFKKDYKRVDHRHHALDALIIAATSRRHIQYLNTLNSQNHDGIEKQKYAYLVKSKVREFVLPWESFTKDAREALQQTVVSHKNRARIITKGFNIITKYVLEENGKWVKKAIKQEKGDLTCVRRSMFKEPLGKILIADYKKVPIKTALKIQLEFINKHQSLWKSDKLRIAKKEERKQINELIKNCEFDEKKILKHVESYPLINKSGQLIESIDLMKFIEVAAKRVTLDKTFTKDKIDKIPYSNHAPLARIMHQHLKDNEDNTGEAFSGEGLEQLAKKIGKPISKITTYEAIGSKTDFKGKLVEADKGSNLFFAIYENIESGERILNEKSSVPLLEVIERKANKLPIADDKEGYHSIILSPNDLVYVPEPDENTKAINWRNDTKKISDRLYKVVSFSGSECHFIPHYISSLILPYDAKTKKGEFGSLNKSEKTIDGSQTIKKVCIKLKVDRLGNIEPYS